MWVVKVKKCTEALALGFRSQNPDAKEVKFHLSSPKAIYEGVSDLEAFKFFVALRTVREISFFCFTPETIDLNTALRFAACGVCTASITFVNFNFTVTGGNVNVYRQWWSPTVLFRGCTVTGSPWTLSWVEEFAVQSVLERLKSKEPPPVHENAPVLVSFSEPWSVRANPAARTVIVQGALPRDDWHLLRVSFPSVIRVQIPAALATKEFYDHVREVGEIAIECRTRESGPYYLDTLLAGVAQTVGVGLVRFLECDDLKWRENETPQMIVDRRLSIHQRNAAFVALRADIDKMWADRLLLLRRASAPQVPSPEVVAALGLTSLGASQ